MVEALRGGDVQLLSMEAPGVRDKESLQEERTVTAPLTKGDTGSILSHTQSPVGVKIMTSVAAARKQLRNASIQTQMKQMTVGGVRQELPWVTGGWDHTPGVLSSHTHLQQNR